MTRRTMLLAKIMSGLTTIVVPRPGRPMVARRIASGAAAVVAGVALTFGVAGTAHADPVRPASTPPEQCDSGCLWAYTMTYEEGWQCTWYNSDANWGDDCVDSRFAPNGMRNHVQSVYNDSNAGNYVRLYYHPNYTGAYACVPPLGYWANLFNYTFDHGSGDGYGRAVADNVASSRFTKSC